ncbi:MULTISPECIES: YceI family protein [Pseudoclavibacter]|uniref:Polyisoprenoid-binding protein YceI n=2 Tax=Pseudoclavibacter TaxID=255204 RepID=A0A7W4UNX2_9MICO|nr:MULTISPECIES: YceI family protein [Pseudoclavibacter]KAB1637595.1 YceI family protein [Pseudoclavibacter terrae]MBB2957915.1 polyisoprenoid-binding protein YceI [Pseudoclavibacter helvolus]MBS3179248.1 polyisoprenoid-binding protein [Pseudoclavibacter sp. Marseille-Q4354]NYF12034.1 polyisoprenoid-binding protein YceI [Pseudoclavibacter sp. JAI123]PPG27129.1 polyisoprenoid-binding protein [Pseudoclavibacter sp. RFBB5]
MSISAADINGWTAGTWNIDPTHTEVGFVVRHLAISKVRGGFETFSGVITTGETIEESTVNAEVEVASVNTKQPARDQHLATSDFFLAEEFPTFTFASSATRVEGDSVKVDGELTLRGVTKPVTFDVEFGGITTDGYGQKKLGFEAVTKINRKDFGVNWNAPTEAGGLTLGDTVTINLDVQATLAQ